MRGITLKQTERGATRWQVVPEWESVLFDAQGLKLNDWIEGGHAHVIKSGEHRTVYRVDLAERSFFVKHYRRQRLGAALWRLIRTSASRREWQKAVEISNRGAPTIRPLALGESREGGFTRDNYFISETVGGAQPLSELLAGPAGRNAASRRKIITSLARLCANAHRKGIQHDDFHLGNILVRNTASNGDIELVLIDLPGVRISGPLSWRRSRENLAMLSAAWIRKMSAAEQMRFWLTYLKARSDLSLPDVRRAARDLVLATRKYTREIVARCDKRSTRNSSAYHAVRTKKGIGYSIAAFRRDDLERLIEDPERAIHESCDKPLVLGHGSSVFEAWLPVGDKQVRVAYKRYRIRKWWKIPFTPFRASRALATWKIGVALANRGIATARPIAVVHPPAFSYRRDSYVATQWIEDACDLHHYAWKLQTLGERERTPRTRECIRKLAELLGRLHEWGFRHRDIKGCNVVARETADGIDVSFVDVDGIRSPFWLLRGMREKNLARLSASFDAHPWITRADRVRFLKVYLRAIHRDPAEWKAVFRSVAPRASQTRARLERKGLIA